MAEILEHAFLKSGELNNDPGLALDIHLSAMGHDLYEDTEIERRQVTRDFGPRVHELISHMTNEDGDHDRAAYVQKIRQSAEEIKLIKLADLTENTTTVAYGIHDNGVDWTRSFFLPVVSEMKQVITIDQFTLYRKTAAILLDWLDFSYSRMVSNLNKFKSV